MPARVRSRPPRLLALDRLRRIAGALAGTVETVTFGHPTFKAGGKAFAVLDCYGGRDCLWLRVDSRERDRLLSSPGWFESPYDPRRTALCCRLEVIDWRRMGALVRRSRELAAPRPGRPTAGPLAGTSSDGRPGTRSR